MLLWFVYYILSAWADYVNGSVPGIAFLNFEGASSVVSLCVVVVHCHCFLPAIAFCLASTVVLLCVVVVRCCALLLCVAVAFCLEKDEFEHA